jgi:hypothetical protein
MKFLKYVLLCLAAEFLLSSISAQTDYRGYDSLSVFKPKRNQNLYQFSDSGAREIQYSLNRPKQTKLVNTGHILGDAGNGFLTALTGINFASSRDLNWIIDGTISCNDVLPDWNINLLCEGNLEKNRQRVRNDDDSWSVETEKTVSLYWEKNATDAIIEGNDTIGAFLIIMDPWTNPLLKQWSANISSEPEPQIKTASNNRFYKDLISYPDVSYGIIGKFRKKEFVVISNGNSRKTWIISGNIITSMFRPDMDDSRISNKDRVQPYLLINSDISHPERRDFFRLAILSRYLSRALKL